MEIPVPNDRPELLAPRLSLSQSRIAQHPIWTNDKFDYPVGTTVIDRKKVFGYLSRLAPRFIHTVDPEVNDDTDRLFDAILLQIAPHALSPMGISFRCDVSFDGRCDHIDRTLMSAAKGTCRGNVSFLPRLDINGNGCVDDVEQEAWELSFAAVSEFHTFFFTDDIITPGVTFVRDVHLLELRAAIDKARRQVGLSLQQYTVGISRGQLIQAQHLIELRTAVTELYRQEGLAPFSFSHPDLAPGMTVKAAHVSELRAAVLAALSH